MRELRRVLHSFCLQQVTAFVAGNDLQPGPNRESNSRYKGIPKPNAVHVLAASSHDEFAARFVAGYESIENSKVDAVVFLPQFNRCKP